MKYLINSSEGIPKIFVVTHFTELIRTPLVRSSSIQYSFMKAYLRDRIADKMILTDSNSNEFVSSLSPVRHELIFAYKLAHLEYQSTTSLPSSSYAFFAALHAGCSKQIVERAIGIMKGVLDPSSQDELFCFKKRDDRIEYKRQWAKTSCELLLKICDKLRLSDKSDPHALFCQHELHFRLEMQRNS